MFGLTLPHRDGAAGPRPGTLAFYFLTITAHDASVVAGITNLI